jgi:DNA topoisomerase IB
MPRLRRSNCGAPGIARRRRGSGFEYLDSDGKHIDDPEVLERIDALAIPSAWREVWICMDPRGHLQATGQDAAGRKQYLYHERWRSHRDRLKFDSMLEFGHALPRLRRRVSKDLRFQAPLSASDLTEPLVLACTVRLLDLGFFRIGSDDYAERNESYGLSTMLREHVMIDTEEVIFDFPAKSGQRRVQAIADTKVLQILSALKRRRSGQQLLAYRQAGRWVDLDAAAVNEYIKRYSGGEFTAKDFRTWNATVLAAVSLADGEPKASRPQRERTVRETVKTVAAYLGNTPAVCRVSYIDPRIIDRYHAKTTISTIEKLPSGTPNLANTHIRALIEDAVLELLADAPTSRRAV